jgi:hypothetical protein
VLIDNGIYISSQNGQRLTTFKFYTELLCDLGDYYRSSDYNREPPIISLDRNLIIDPLVLPLLATMGAYLKSFHKKPLFLELENDLSSNGLIRFLIQSDFLYVVGDNKNPQLPLGKEIFIFDKRVVGGFSSNKGNAS